MRQVDRHQDEVARAGVEGLVTAPEPGVPLEDEERLVLHQVPILLGRGVRVWDGLEGLEQDYAVEVVGSPTGVTHLTFDRKIAA